MNGGIKIRPTPTVKAVIQAMKYTPCYKSGGVAHGVMQNTAETVALNAASKVGSRKRHLFITNIYTQCANTTNIDVHAL